jgi:hypothetical protein
MGEADGSSNRGPFAMMPLAVLKHPTLSPRAKVLFGLLLHYSGQNQACWPSQEQLATDLQVSERAIRALLRELEQASLLKSNQRGRGMSNVYELVFPDRKKTSGQNRMTGRKLPPRPEADCRSRPEENFRSLLGEQEPNEQDSLNQKGGELPNELNTAQFREAWPRWKRHLAEKKRPLTPTSERAQLDMLKEIGSENAVALINRSIRNGWQGLDYKETNNASRTGDLAGNSRVIAPANKYAAKRTIRAGQAEPVGSAAATA